MKKITLLLILILLVACQKTEVSQPIVEEISPPVAKEVSQPEKQQVVEKIQEVKETKTLYKTGILRSQNRQTTGNVKIYLIKRDKEEFFLIDIPNLDLKSFKTDDLQNIHVYLSGDSNPKSPQVLEREYFDLGKLQSFSGMQSYSLSTGVDIDKYNGIVIYQIDPESIFAVGTLIEEEKVDNKIG